MRKCIAPLLALAFVVSFDGRAEAQCSVVGGVDCSLQGGTQVLVTWTNDPSEHSSYTVTRDGLPVATVPSSQSSYLDNPGTGAFTYRVVSDCGFGASCGATPGVSAFFGVEDVTATGSTVTVPVTLSHSGSGGCNGGVFGIGHDPGVLTIQDVLVGSALLGVNGGNGPAFFGFNLDPDPSPSNSAGVVIIITVTYGGLSDMVPPGNDAVVAELVYTVNPTAPTGLVTPLEFDDLLGTPDIGYALAIENVPAGVIDPPVDGSVTIGGGGNGGGGPMLLRGAADGDGSMGISDPIALLLHLFAGGPLNCRDATDFDDDGNLGIADAIAPLQYLFAAGPDPAAPYPACGPDPSDDGLDCQDAGAMCGGTA